MIIGADVFPENFSNTIYCLRLEHSVNWGLILREVISSEYRNCGRDVNAALSISSDVKSVNSSSHVN